MDQLFAILSSLMTSRKVNQISITGSKAFPIRLAPTYWAVNNKSNIQTVIKIIIPWVGTNILPSSSTPLSPLIVAVIITAGVNASSAGNTISSTRAGITSHLAHFLTKV